MGKRDLGIKRGGGKGRVETSEERRGKSKAGYKATEVACGWAGAIFEVTRPFGQEQ